MITKKLVNKERIRRIHGGFSFIPHKFLTDGFLVLVSDRHGVSFYAYDSICSLLQLTLDDYLKARDSLIKKDLIAFDGTLFQVLALPPKPISGDTLGQEDRGVIAKIIRQSLQEACNA